MLCILPCPLHPHSHLHLHTQTHTLPLPPATPGRSNNGNDNAALSLQAFASFLATPYPHHGTVSDAAVIGLFDAFNSSRSGMLSFSELCVGLNAFLHGTSAMRAQIVFRCDSSSVT